MGAIGRRRSTERPVRRSVTARDSAWGLRTCAEHRGIRRSKRTRGRHFSSRPHATRARPSNPGFDDLGRASRASLNSSPFCRSHRRPLRARHAQRARRSARGVARCVRPGVSGPRGPRRPTVERSSARPRGSPCARLGADLLRLDTPHPFPCNPSPFNNSSKPVCISDAACRGGIRRWRRSSTAGAT